MELIVFFQNIGMGFLGIAFIVWLNTVTAGRGSFTLSIWINENTWSIGCSIVGVMIAALIHQSDPKLLSAFQVLSGVDMVTSVGGWFTFSVAIYSTIRKFEKRKNKKS